MILSFLPSKCLYEAGFGSDQYSIQSDIIGVAQPHRIAAKRVAFELGLSLYKEISFQVGHIKLMVMEAMINLLTAGDTLSTTPNFHPILLPSLKLWPRFPPNLEGAKKARYDKEAVMKFFRMLIRWRYFSDDLPAPNPWSTPVQRPLQRSSESLSDEDQLYKSTSLIGDPYKYNVLLPLPAQLNLTPTPTLYPQQPMSNPDNNCSIPRYAVSSSQEISSTRLKHSDINV